MKKIESNVLIFFAAWLSVVGVFAFDMHLPAMTDIQNFYHTSEYYTGLTASIYMIGFAFAQLLYGSLSDQIGRKPSLIFGLIIFLIGSIGCAYASDIMTFLLFRFIQAIGVCAAYILWQPIIIDLYEEEKARAIFTRIMALGALSPAIAPFIGGQLAGSLGWQSIFYFQTAMTVVILLWASFFLKETLKNRENKIRISKLVEDYKIILSDSVFRGLVLGISLAVTCYLSYLTIAPFLLSGIGYKASEIGLTYFPIAISFFLGAEVAKRLVSKIGAEGVVKVGSAISAIGSIAISIYPIANQSINVVGLLIPVCLVAFGNSFVVPTGSALLMQRLHFVSGSCASILGFSIALVAFVSTAISSFCVEIVGAATLAIVLLPSSILGTAFINLGLMRNKLVPKFR